MQDESEHEAQYIEKMDVNDFDEGLGKQGKKYSPHVSNHPWNR